MIHALGIGAVAYPLTRSSAAATTAAPTQSISMQLVTITPQMAAKWLDTVPPNQRKLRERRVKTYADDMVNGNWRITHQGIAFDVDGNLIDGQHRLNAIVAAGVAVPMYVASGLPRASIANVDLGFPRTTVDVLNVEGHGYGLRSMHVAVAKFLIRTHGIASGASATCSPFEIEKYVRKHLDALTFAIQCFDGKAKKKGITSAPVVAAIAAARSTLGQQAEPNLRAFADVLWSGVCVDLERDAVTLRLRDVLLSHGIRSGNAPQRSEIYGKTQRAIQAFMAGQNVTKIYNPSQPPFTMASED